MFSVVSLEQPLKTVPLMVSTLLGIVTDSRFLQPLNVPSLSLVIEDGMVIEINDSQEPSEAVLRLLELANQNGGKDNISIIIVEP